MSEIRLHKFLAEAGIASRRKCEEMITKGLVKVDGKVVTAPGTKIKGSEKILVNGVEVKPNHKKVYILLNKPVGYISSVKDQFSRKTVLDLVNNIKERIYPVGRLDYDTSGLIILTNDGDFANKLMHPRHMIRKVYRAEITGKLSSSDIECIETGVQLEDYKTAPAGIKVISTSKDRSLVEVSICEGKNRQIRKMFDSLNHPVLRLKRIAIGPVGIDGLEEGKWRYLSKNEVMELKNAVVESVDPG